jgi:hypothetical protein
MQSVIRSLHPLGRVGERCHPHLLAAVFVLLSLPDTARAQLDSLPFGLLYGAPEIQFPAPEIHARLWSEGGRIHLRFVPDQKTHEISGSLVATGEGILKDIAPVSKQLRIRQQRPSRVDFDGTSDRTLAGLDVILAGDFQSLIVDIKIDGRQLPQRLLIGSDRDSPNKLPVEFGLGGADETWLDRFGF